MIAPGHVFVIAEAGVNHNGSVDTALRLVYAAAEAGADAVKFQSFRADSLASAGTPMAGYQKEALGASGDQLQMLRALELSVDDHRRIMERCLEVGIEFLSSPFDAESIDLLSGLGLRRLKVPSGELTDVPYLRRIAATGLPLIVSTGMSTLDEVSAALDVLATAGCSRERVVVLHCSSEYPTPLGDVNLRAMVTMRDALDVAVGYSDHTEDLTVAIAATALGAAAIEKHLTLDRTLPGPDHRASIEPADFALLVGAIRDVETALGDGTKRPTEGELENAATVRKSIVAARRIETGEHFTEENLTVKRPGTGMSPLLWDALIGRRASRDYEGDALIEERVP